MLQPISDLPPHVIGIYAFSTVSDLEYENALIPLIDDLLKTHSKINFVLILETDIRNFVSGAWCGNIRLGIKYFFKWNRVALVTDQKSVLGYSDLFKHVLPGKFENFRLDQLDKAIRWVSVKDR